MPWTAPLTLDSAQLPHHTIEMHSIVHTPMISVQPLFLLHAPAALRHLLTIAIEALIKFSPRRAIHLFAVACDITKDRVQTAASKD